MQLVGRIASDDVEINGVTVSKGDRMALLLAAAWRPTNGPMCSFRPIPRSTNSPSPWVCTSAPGPRWHAWRPKWAPEAMVVAGFGQIIDAPVTEFPRHGIYNVHPSDLVGGHGAGPQPWEDAVARKAAVTRVSLIRVTPEVDAGVEVALDDDEGELTV